MAALVALAAALGVVVLGGGGAEPAARPAAATVTGTTATTRPPGFDHGQVRLAFLRIQQQRVQALARADAAALAQVYHPACPCLAADRRLLALGLRLAGPGPQVRSAEVLAVDPVTRTAVVRAALRVPALRYVDRSGQVRRQEPDGGVRAVVARLAWDGQRWRQLNLEQVVG